LLDPEARIKIRGVVHRLLFLIPQAAASVPLRSLSSGPIRSLWAGQAIHTLASNAEAERTQGVAADSLVYKRYATRADFTFDLTRWTRLPVLGKVLPYFVLAWSLRRYERFHFFYNRGLLAQVEPGRFNVDELVLLRKLDKQVFFWAYGADVRTREATLAVSAPNCCQFCPAVTELCVCDQQTGTENYSFIRNLATGCASMGDMRWYTPGSDNSIFYWPVDLEVNDGELFAHTALEADTAGPLRLAHAPNTPELKGTQFLLDAVAALQHEGLDITLDLVRGVSNDEVMDRFRSADVIFDQCLIGFHGYTALEAMALGRPVLCFLREPATDLVDPETCPIVNVTPATIADELRTLYGQDERRRTLGEAGRRYVQDHHSLEAVGARIQSFIERCHEDI
jgi:hypothetical protein